MRNVRVKPNIPAVLKQQCPVLTEPKGTSGADMYAWGISVIQDYRVCKQRHRDLVAAVEAEVKPQDSLQPVGAGSTAMLKSRYSD